MKIYVAGCLREEKDRNQLEEVEKVCRKFGETYLPHRDKGLFVEGMDPEPIFKENSDRIDWCDVIVAVLDWRGISSGTAWELGYAYAKKIPIIALVEDKKTIHKDYRICVMCYNKDLILVESFKELRKEISNLKS
ncbi:nucleoside 2-deoxyribosyltransferase [Candidatus Woesearchaeota archaeon]|nr:nucleoside 2-deoxyribosyltransferase [Candidatus Woesearchaeota archaeon]